MLHGFVLSELRRILNAGVLRLEIGRLDSSCRNRILNFRFESRHTVARRCKKCERARVPDEPGRINRVYVRTAEVKIEGEILRRGAPQNNGGVRRRFGPALQQSSNAPCQSWPLWPGFGHGAQASA